MVFTDKRFNHVLGSGGFADAQTSVERKFWIILQPVLLSFAMMR